MKDSDQYVAFNVQLTAVLFILFFHEGIGMYPLGNEHSIIFLYLLCLLFIYFLLITLYRFYCLFITFSLFPVFVVDSTVKTVNNKYISPARHLSPLTSR